MKDNYPLPELGDSLRRTIWNNLSSPFGDSPSVSIRYSLNSGFQGPLEPSLWDSLGEYLTEHPLTGEVRE